MADRILEFRGIPLKVHLQYFKELHGEIQSEPIPMTISGNSWTADILREEQISITKSFKVNAIFIRFSSPTLKGLEDIIKMYRKKTFRAGG